MPNWKGPAVPVLTLKGERIEVFLDKSHQLFRLYRIKPEALVAAELAQYLYDLNRPLLRPPYLGYHSVANLAWLIMSKYWEDLLEDSAERVKGDIERFFDALKGQLARLAEEVAEDLFNDLSEDEQRALTNNMLAEGQDLTKLAEWKHDDYVLFARNASYFAGAPKADSLRARIVAEPSTSVAEYESGNVDILQIPASEAQDYVGERGFPVFGVQPPLQSPLKRLCPMQAQIDEPSNGADDEH